MNGLYDWHVLVFEEKGMGDRKVRELSHTMHTGPDIEEARSLAFETAQTHRPEHPTVPRSRQVFQTSADSWVVKTDGATRAYYFTVQVGRLVADDEGELANPSWIDLVVGEE